MGSPDCVYWIRGGDCTANDSVNLIMYDGIKILRDSGFSTEAALSDCDFGNVCWNLASW